MTHASLCIYVSHFYGSSCNSLQYNCNITPVKIGGIFSFDDTYNPSLTLTYKAKIKWMDFTFLFKMTDHKLNDLNAQNFSSDFQVGKILEQSQAFTPDYYHMVLRWYSSNKMR